MSVPVRIVVRILYLVQSCKASDLRTGICFSCGLYFWWKVVLSSPANWIKPCLLCSRNFMLIGWSCLWLGQIHFACLPSRTPKQPISVPTADLLNVQNGDLEGLSSLNLINPALDEVSCIQHLWLLSSHSGTFQSGITEPLLLSCVDKVRNCSNKTENCASKNSIKITNDVNKMFSCVPKVINCAHYLLNNLFHNTVQNKVSVFASVLIC